MSKGKILDDRTLPLETRQYYHIFNRGNSKLNIFYNTENYHYFLKKYVKYLSDYVETYAYCLLPNHFHLLIRVKPIKNLLSLENLISLESIDVENMKRLENVSLNESETEKINKEISGFIGNQFRLLFMSYAKAINKQEDLRGSLFQKIFRRKRINDINYLMKLVGYIHFNPIHHNISKSIENYPYSSYKSILSDKKTLLMRKEILEWFGGRKSFIESHNSLIEMEKDKKYWIEVE